MQGGGLSTYLGGRKVNDVIKPKKFNINNMSFYQ